MKNLILIFFVSLHLQYNFAQTAIIKGKVIGAGEPIAFASIGISGTKYGCISDEKGEFILKNISQGRFFIECTAIGYSKTGLWVQTENQHTSNIQFNLKPLQTNLQELTISGTLKEVSKLNSPVPVEIYSQKFFLKNPSPGLFDALQMINGVQPTLNCNVCNTGDIHINGLDGPYTLVLIDGMPIVSALSTVYGLSGIPTSLIERVEIVKGPAATLYGSEAVGGLINGITKNADNAPGFSFDYYGTSYLENNMDIGFSKKMGKLSLLSSGNFFYFNNRVDINKDNFTDVTLQKRVSLFSKLQYKRKGNLMSSLALRYYDEDRFGGEMQWTPAFRAGDSVYGESIYTKRFELLGSHPFNWLNQSFRFQVSYNFHAQNSAYGRTFFLAQQQTAFNQLLWNKRICSRHDALIGLALKYTFYDDNTLATRAILDTLKNMPVINMLPGIFIQDEFAINEKQTILLGSRLDYYKVHGFIFSPRVNYKIQLNNNNTLRLSTGNGFRVVNIFTEDHAALTGARAIVIVNKIKPEQSWNLNLQYSKFISYKYGFMSLDASLFYTYFSNKIVADFDKDPNKIFYDNLKEYAVSKGLTLNSEVSFTFPLKVNAGITLMDVYTVLRDSSNKIYHVQQLHAPRFSGTFQLTYAFKKAGLNIDFTGQVYGPMRLPVLPNDFRPDYSPWFSLQNVQLTKTLKKGFELYGGIKNLWNYLPKDPIMRAFDPFDKKVNDVINNPYNYTFDPSYNYAPLYGIRGFLGIRYRLK